MTDTTLQRLAVPSTHGVDLRTELAIPSTPRAVMVMCHPHPLHGGSMYANVVEAVFGALPDEGVAVARFNFRGTNGSTGRHDGGRGERDDVAAVVATAADRWPGLPLVLGGYSFGAMMALTVDHPALTGWLAVAPVLKLIDRADLVAADDQRPLRLVAGVHDQYQDLEELRAFAASATATDLTPVDGADHFFAVGLDAVIASARELSVPT
ncbi:MAG: alpha/beta hydrolase [Acidimicrobiales bacterium]